MATRNAVHAAIAATIRVVNSGNEQAVITALGGLPLANMADHVFYPFLVALLNVAVNSGHRHLLPPLIQAFQQNNPKGNLPVETKLFALRGAITDDLLREIKTTLDVTLFEDHIRNLAQFDMNSDFIFPVCQRLVSTYGIPTYSACVRLQEFMQEQHIEEGMPSYPVLSFINSIASRLTPMADKPTWIKGHVEVFDEELPNTPLPELHREIPDLEESLRRLVTQFQEDVQVDLGTIDNEDLEELLQKSRATTLAGRLNLLEPIYTPRDPEAVRDAVALDEEAFRMFGPSNPPYQVDPETDTIRSYRMFTSNERGNYDPENGPIDEDLDTESQLSWFTGSCDKCQLRIQKPCYAVRTPIPPWSGGGWDGCYCSIEHMLEDRDEPLLQEGPEGPDGGEEEESEETRAQIRTYNFIEVLILEFQSQLDYFGIYDRQYLNQFWLDNLVDRDREPDDDEPTPGDHLEDFLRNLPPVARPSFALGKGVIPLLRQ